MLSPGVPLELVHMGKQRMRKVYEAQPEVKIHH